VLPPPSPPPPPPSINFGGDAPDAAAPPPLTSSPGTKVSSFDTAVPTLDLPFSGDTGVDLPDAKSASESVGMGSTSLPSDDASEEVEGPDAAAAEAVACCGCCSNVMVVPSAASLTIFPVGSKIASTKNSTAPRSTRICSIIAATSLLPLPPTPAAPEFRTLPSTLTLTLIPGTDAEDNEDDDEEEPGPFQPGREEDDDEEAVEDEVEEEDEEVPAPPGPCPPPDLPIPKLPNIDFISAAPGISAGAPRSGVAADNEEVNDEEEEEEAEEKVEDDEPCDDKDDGALMLLEVESLDAAAVPVHTAIEAAFAGGSTPEDDDVRGASGEE
jgi:hypothetical protein